MKGGRDEFMKGLLEPVLAKYLMISPSNIVQVMTRTYRISAVPVPKETSSSKPAKAPPKAQQIVFKDKKEAMEAFKELLREKNVPSTANWYVFDYRL